MSVAELAIQTSNPWLVIHWALEHDQSLTDIIENQEITELPLDFN